ncbi:GGDEF domain-containing protein [Roseivivax sp. CAU 1761]
MTLPAPLLDRLCPLHLWIGGDGRVRQAGPTLRKLLGGDPGGEPLLDLCEVVRPRALASLSALLAAPGRKLRLRLRQPPRTGFVGHLHPDGAGGAVLDLSFGLAVADAVQDHALTSSDFAPTDLSVELLFLLEAKTAAMDSSRRLNQRLQSARAAAEEEALTDPLTGLGNRRSADQTLARLSRARAPFGLLHIDLDRFKQVNDSLGHAAGDAVLQAVGGLLPANLRHGDRAARVGGDEFLVVIPGTPDPGRLRALAERLIAAIEAPVIHDGAACRVSASIGIALHAAGAAQAPDTLLRAADRALYAAKARGRGRAAFDPEAGPAASDPAPEAPRAP